jgi:hypothetical protein
MRAPRWPAAQSIFVGGLGFAMAAFFTSAFVFSQRSTEVGSDLVPAWVLEKLVSEGRLCQTVSDADILRRAPRRVC